MNRRTLTQWLGAGLFVFAAAGLAVTFPPEPFLGLQMVLLVVAGALLFAGGVTDRVRWSLLSGLGNVALGASLVVGSVGGLGANPDTGDWFYALIIGVGGLTLAGIGVLYIVEHDAFDTQP